METLFGKIFLLWTGLLLLVETGIWSLTWSLRGFSHFAFADIRYFAPSKPDREPTFQTRGSFTWVTHGLKLLVFLLVPISALLFLFGDWPYFLWAGATLHFILGVAFWLPKLQRDWTWKWVMRLAGLLTFGLSLVCEALFANNLLLRVLALVILVGAGRLAPFLWKKLARVNERDSAKVLLGTILLFSALYCYMPLAAGAPSDWETACFCVRDLYRIVFDLLWQLFGLVG